MTRAGTQANAAFLSPVFLDEVVARYAGTRLGRQELDGELIDDRPDALWSRDTIEQARVPAAPELARIVVGIDPPAGRGTCGIVAAGRNESGTIYVLEDASVTGLSPLGWASHAVGLYRRLKADTLVAEVNQGGSMVADVLRQVDSAVAVKSVQVSRGKYLRAEPVSAMYEQRKVKHVDPPMRELEDQMCDFGENGLSSGASPDRLDALVLAVAELSKPVHPGPRVRWI